MSTHEGAEQELPPKKKRRRRTGNSAIIAYIATRRAELRLTQTQLSERAGIDRGTLAGIEAGHVSPSRMTLAKLAPVLGTTYEAMDRIVRGKPPVEGPDHEAHMLSKAILSLPKEKQMLVRSMVDSLLFQQAVDLGGY